MTSDLLSSPVLGLSNEQNLLAYRDMGSVDINRVFNFTVSIVDQILENAVPNGAEKLSEQHQAILQANALMQEYYPDIMGSVALDEESVGHLVQALEDYKTEKNKTSVDVDALLMKIKLIYEFIKAN